MKCRDFGVLLRVLMENKQGGETVGKAWILEIMTIDNKSGV